MVFHRAPTLRRKPKDCQRKPNNLLLIVLNPEFANCSLLIIEGMEKNSNAMVIHSSVPDCLRGPRSRSGIAFFVFHRWCFPNPKELHMLNVNDVIFFEKWKNIWIYLNITRAAHSSLRIWLDLIGKLCIWVHRFWNFHAWFEQNPERGKLWQLVKHGWIREMFILVSTCFDTCSRPTKNCISKTSPGWRFWNLGKLRSGIGLDVHQRIPSETKGWSQVMQQRSLITNLKRTSESLKLYSDVWY